MIRFDVKSRGNLGIPKGSAIKYRQEEEDKLFSP